MCQTVPVTDHPCRNITDFVFYAKCTKMAENGVLKTVSRIFIFQRFIAFLGQELRHLCHCTRFGETPGAVTWRRADKKTAEGILFTAYAPDGAKGDGGGGSGGGGGGGDEDKVWIFSTQLPPPMTNAVGWLELSESLFFLCVSGN